MNDTSTNRSGPSRRALAVASTATLLFAAVVSAWGFLAAQSPSSPLHVGPLVGPVVSLAQACWLAGAIGFALAAALPTLSLRKGDERRTVALLALGWAILVVAMTAGAVLGTTGTQVIKAYPRTVAVMLGRFAGFAALLAGLVSLLVGLLRRPRA
ncbi:MAG: hypothetical protein M0R80_05910 [Proteobacteria bacterium]|jgi:hypothetical protein|nr:hypothetical protein [Pseudomonadota bacterium]